MAHPKRRTSRTRRDKRRTHHALTPLHLHKCPVTGVAAPPHVAFWHEGSLYYRGSVVIQGEEKNKEEGA